MWDGRESPAHANRLIEHLQLVPGSRTAAIQQGDIEWMGWDVNTVATVQMQNLLAVLLGGLSKGFDTQAWLIDGPTRSEAEEPLIPTIAEFSAAAAMRWVHGD